MLEKFDMSSGDKLCYIEYRLKELELINCIMNGLETEVVRCNFDNFKTVYKDQETVKILQIRKEEIIKKYISMIQ